MEVAFADTARHSVLYPSQILLRASPELRPKKTKYAIQTLDSVHIRMPIKIEQLVRKKQLGAGIAPALLEYMENHPDRAFSYDDLELAQIFPRVKSSTIGWAMWHLFRNGFIRQIRAGRKVYFCSVQAYKKFVLESDKAEDSKPKRSRGGNPRP